MSPGSRGRAEDTHIDGCIDTVGGHQPAGLPGWGTGSIGDAFLSRSPVLGGNNPETFGDILQPS